MPSLTRAAWTTPVMSRPLSRIAPAVGRRTPVKRSTNVVLPAPFGPIRAWRAPASSRKLISRAAASAPKLRQSARVSRIGLVMTPRLAPAGGVITVVRSPRTAGPPPRDAGDRRRDRVAENEASPHRRPDGVHPQHVLADPPQALAERRIDQRAHEDEAHEEHGEAVEVLRLGIQRIELEHAEQRSDRQTVETVEAAGVVVREIGGLLEQRHGA